MTEFFHLFSQLSAAATGALVSAVWQGVLVAAFVGLCLRFIPALSAAARSIIWLNVFILLALLHLLPFALGNAATPHVAAHGITHGITLDLRWSMLVAALWLALSIARAAQLVWGALHLSALARRAVVVEPGPELEALLRAPGNRIVQLCVSDEVARPSVLGFFRPRILVPPELLAGLAPAELQQVVTHEMEHLHRGDDWTNLLQKLALVVFPLNPALLWVERRLCAERELACDDRVLRSGSGRKAYALCLTHLAEYSLMRRGFSLLLGAWERRPELVRRVQRILVQPARTMGRTPALAVSGTLMAGALGCTLTLAHAPQLVHFVPAASPDHAQTLPPLDPEALGRALGGTPQMIRATLPQQATMLQRTIAPQQQSARLNHRSFSTPKTIQARAIQTKAVLRRPAHSLPPDTRLAQLRTPPPPDGGQMLVMTEWTQIPVTRQVVVTHWTVAQPQQQAVPALYVVRTPVGWLIVQI